MFSLKSGGRIAGRSILMTTLGLVASALIFLAGCGGTGSSLPSSTKSTLSHAGEMGSTINFGVWEGSPITWRVLFVDNKNKALLLSERVLCERPYNAELKDVTWEESDLRAWLNGEFLTKAFTDPESAAIPEMTLKNQGKELNQYNQHIKVEGGADTKDRVFLLSEKDAKSIILASQELRVAKDRLGNTCFWWLRSPGNASFSAVIVGMRGEIYGEGFRVKSDTGVRPALWLDLNSAIFK